MLGAYGDEEAASRPLQRPSGPAESYDPLQPILNFPGRGPMLATECRYNQRVRRSQILATIRGLLMEHGYEGVTVRRIAEASTHAVQTIYNLVGPRDRAIIEAISEYTRWVGRTAIPSAEDPFATIRIMNSWMESIEMSPAFCRRVTLIFFTESRHIYYTLRDRQQLGLTKLLAKQQRCGVVRADADVKSLAEQMVLLESAACLEWADRDFPLEQMRRQLSSGYAVLLADKLAPQHRLAVASWPVPLGRGTRV